MRIVVTGAAGAVGSHVAEALLKEGHDVRGIDAYTPYYAKPLKQLNIGDLKKSGVQFVEADLCRDNLEPLLEGAEIIYHFAAQPGISAATPFADYLNNNIVATKRLLDAAKKTDTVRLFVFISTSSVYGKHANSDETTAPTPSSVYGVTKLAAEQLALAQYRDGGIPTVVLRLFSVYGERERPDKLYHKLIRAILNGEAFPLHEGSLSHVRSYSYVGDIVRGCLAVLHKPEAVGEIFNLGTDKTITTGEGFAIVERLLGTKALIKNLPPRPGDQMETSAKIGKARKILGYNPQVLPEEGLAREIAWYKEKVFGKITI